MNRRIFFILIYGFASISHAYVYEIKALRKWDKDENRYHYFLGFSDFHDKSHQSNLAQRSLIEDLLCKFDRSSCKILVEDLSSSNSKGIRGFKDFQIQSKGGILAGMGDFCRQHRIPYENVEYRYCRVATMGPVINNLHANPALFMSTKSTTVQSIIDEIEHTMADINAQVKSPVLKKAYALESKKVRAIFDKMLMKKYKNVSIAKYLQENTKKQNKVNMLKSLLTFDSGLLDIKLAMEITKSKDKQHVIAFAGGTHISQVCQLLKKLGYTEFKSTPVSYKKQSMAKANGLDAILGVKPDPVSTQIIEEYLQMQAQ